MDRLRTFLGCCLRFGWWFPLVIPCGWFWASTPPLWRDSDGFNQVCAEIGGLTLLLWPPLYCLLARVPLAVGAWWKNVPFSFNEPALTDAGVGLLISLQHLLWIAAAGWFISVITQRHGIRLALAIVVACVPAYYAFAHTVGSESLSNATQFAVMAGGACVLKNLRLRWRPWAGYSCLLALAILTRHVNAVFAALLPIAFLLRAVAAWAHASRPDRVSRLRIALIPAGVAMLAGCAAIGAANLTVRALCLASDTAYHSKLGFIFQWRIAFIESRPAPERAAFFDALYARLRDPLAIRALRAYAAAIDAGQNPSAEFLNEYIKEALKKNPDYNRKERLIFTADSLGHIASTTVTSFPPGYVDAVWADFRKNFTLHLDAITREPAASTQFFTTALAAPEFRPLRSLVTFRGDYYRRAVSDFSSRPYLRLGRGISLLTLTLAALILWLATLARSDRRSWHVVYPPSLLIVGGILIFLNCCTTFFMPRFALPLLGTILAASLISIACLLEWISVRKSQRPDPVSTSQAPR